MWPFSSSSSSSSSSSAGSDRTVAADLTPPSPPPPSAAASSSSILTTPNVHVPTASGPRLNIPSGNSAISEPSTIEDEKLSGDRWADYRSAFQRINVGEDISKIGEIPCARSSLLYGIGGGSAIGAVRYLGSRSPKAGANWAVMGFVVIALTQWEMCNRARAKELAQMRIIQEKFPHRHVSTLKPIERGPSPDKP